MKVLVTGNCQARPVSNLLQSSAAVDVMPPIVLHLAQEADRGRHLDLLLEADVIVAQQTADTFQIPHLRSSELKQLEKPVVIWPNIFWATQQPFLRYITHSNLGRMLGPFEGMHDLRIFCSWAVGVSDESHLSDYFGAEYIKSVSNQSIQDLRKRERSCDVSISDFLVENAKDKRLFFTFNHPTKIVLQELVKKIIAFLDLPLRQEEISTKPTEPLGRYIVPSIWPEEQTWFQGDSVSIGDNGVVTRNPGPPQKYTFKDLCDLFHAIYEKNQAFLELQKLRLTPVMDVDRAWLKMVQH